MKLTLVLSIAVNIMLGCLTLSLANRLGYLGRVMVAFGVDTAGLPTDTLATRPEWQNELKNQVFAAQNQRYEVCLLGDSISSGLGNTLGSKTFNFAIAGMSSVSQLEQLKQLISAQIKCGTVILALGTNDAAYRSTDAQFVENTKAIIALARTRMDTQKIVMLPAFYSTAEASHDPSLAGPLHRVNRINGLIENIVVQEKALFMNDGLEALFQNQTLKRSLTTDGVHLNSDGEKIYREALLKIIARLSAPLHPLK
jgi:lysophospholipase L1-like esterase